MPSVGRWYIHDSRPSANMFFARPASLRDSPKSFSASTVSVVSGTGWTLYAVQRAVLQRDGLVADLGHRAAW